MKPQTDKQVVMYLTECTLATVSHMAYNKNRPKGEFNRQISIAQTGLDYLNTM